MLSFRAEMTIAELGELILPPSYIWETSRKYGCEWLLWPPPTGSELKDLKKKMMWDEPEEPADSDIVWENDDYIYTPRDVISMLKTPLRTFQHMCKRGDRYDFRPLITSRLFSPRAIRIIMSLMPNLDAPIYPDWMMNRKALKWRD